MTFGSISIVERLRALSPPVYDPHRQDPKAK